MTLEELVKNYDFHDSGLNAIICDEKSGEMILKIEFCQWRQRYFQDGMAEIVPVELCFHHVFKTEYRDFLIENQYDEILDCELLQDPEYGVGIEYLLYDQSDQPYSIQIYAESVDIVGLT